MYYEKIFRILYTQKVDYLIAGGMAVNLYGIPRFTKDLDILVDASDKNLLKLQRALKTLGFRPKAPVTLANFLNPKNWEKWKRKKGMIAFNLYNPKKPYEEIDILIQSPVSFKKARGERKVIRAGGLVLYLVSKRHLMIMKRRAGRLQDLADIEALKKIE